MEKLFQCMKVLITWVSFYLCHFHNYELWFLLKVSERPWHHKHRNPKGFVPKSVLQQVYKTAKIAIYCKLLCDCMFEDFLPGLLLVGLLLAWSSRVQHD